MGEGGDEEPDSSGETLYGEFVLLIAVGGLGLALLGLLCQRLDCFWKWRASRRLSCDTLYMFPFNSSLRLLAGRLRRPRCTRLHTDPFTPRQTSASHQTRACLHLLAEAISCLLTHPRTV
jgi:hypothetical protein